MLKKDVLLRSETRLNICDRFALPGILFSPVFYFVLVEMIFVLNVVRNFSSVFRLFNYYKRLLFHKRYFIKMPKNFYYL